MSKSARLHIGHHIMATIEVKKLIVGLDCDKEQVIWAGNAPEELREAIIDFMTKEKLLVDSLK